MDPRRRFYLEVFGGVAVGLFFVVLGIYGVIISFGNLTNNVRLLYAGAGCIGLGLIIALKSLQYMRPIFPVIQSAVIVCSHCSAIVEEGAENCPKCGKPVEN